MTESKELILLEDITAIIAGAHDLGHTLDRIVDLIADRMGVEVSCIYLFEGGELVLRATRGLVPSAVGTVRMPPEEGLTGLTFQETAPVNVDRPNRHPRYKHFPGIGEEPFGSYLGVPLVHRQRAIGVLSVQTALERSFSPDEVRMLLAAAGQLSGVIANAGLLDALAREKPDGKGKQRRPFLKGEGVSPGFGKGRLLVMTDPMDLDAVGDVQVAGPEEALHRFDRALARAAADVAALRDRVTRSLGEADGAIFLAHLLMLEDRALQEKVHGRIRQGLGPVRAVVAVAHEYMDVFRAMEDPYLRERAADVRDIAHRVVAHLTEEGGVVGSVRLDTPTIVLATDLSPSQLAQLLQPELVGVALVKGGSTAHTAILCRSANIPAVVGIDVEPNSLDPDQPAILDGNAGILYLSPARPVEEEYDRLAADTRKMTDEWAAHAALPAVTVDGVAVGLSGNAALASDIPRIVGAGADGVGLYRTEFPFLIRSSFPTEDEQAETYLRAVRGMEGRPVTFRTLDVGGDKPLPYLPLPAELNPQLGWRSIRVSFDLEEGFRDQLRALLRAAAAGPVRILFPLICDEREMARARRIVDEERAALRAGGVDVPRVPVGAMIEAPSAAVLIERIGAHADFFSIGTNDLAQYLLAVDRGNPKVAHLYDPLHPAVLTVVAGIVEAAGRMGKPVGVCGESAGKGLGAAALLALGVTDLSVSPVALLKVRRLVQCVRCDRLRALAPKLTSAVSGGAVREMLREELSQQGVAEALWKVG